MEQYNVYVPRLLPKKEFFAQGHRACQGCGETIALRHIFKATGRDVIVACATGCTEIISSPLPQSAWRVPWIHVAFENAAAVASGIDAGLTALMRKGRIPEKKICVIAMAGDGGTADIGLQAISGALERGHKNFMYICLDNEAYMNTGIQRSSSTPYGASTTTSPAGRVSIGQQTWKKNMVEIAAAHEIPYTATACPSYPFDLIRKVKKGADVEGPSYIHILAVCPTGWRAQPEYAVRLGRLAVETGVFPLYEIENGQYILNYRPKKLRPLEEYFRYQRRFRHLSPPDIDKIRDRVNRAYQRLLDRSSQA